MGIVGGGIGGLFSYEFALSYGVSCRVAVSLVHDFLLPPLWFMLLLWVYVWSVCMKCEEWTHYIYGVMRGVTTFTVVVTLLPFNHDIENHITKPGKSFGTLFSCQKRLCPKIVDESVHVHVLFFTVLYPCVNH